MTSGIIIEDSIIEVEIYGENVGVYVAPEAIFAAKLGAPLKFEALYHFGSGS